MRLCRTELLGWFSGTLASPRCSGRASATATLGEPESSIAAEPQLGRASIKATDWALPRSRDSTALRHGDARVRGARRQGVRGDVARTLRPESASRRSAAISISMPPGPGRPPDRQSSCRCVRAIWWCRRAAICGPQRPRLPASGTAERRNGGRSRVSSSPSRAARRLRVALCVWRCASCVRRTLARRLGQRRNGRSRRRTTW